MNKQYFNQIIHGEETSHSVSTTTIDWNQIEDALDKATWEINESFGLIRVFQ